MKISSKLMKNISMVLSALFSLSTLLPFAGFLDKRLVGILDEEHIKFDYSNKKTYIAYVEGVDLYGKLGVVYTIIVFCSIITCSSYCIVHC